MVTRSWRCVNDTSVVLACHVSVYILAENTTPEIIASFQTTTFTMVDTNNMPKDISLDPTSFAPEDVIKKDVCVIGGGSSGTNF